LEFAEEVCWPGELDVLEEPRQSWPFPRPRHAAGELIVVALPRHVAGGEEEGFIDCDGVLAEGSPHQAGHHAEQGDQRHDFELSMFHEAAGHTLEIVLSAGKNFGIFPRTMNRRHLIPLLLILAGVCAYANSFWGVFLGDDVSAIIENPHIRYLTPLMEAAQAPPQSALVGRPVACLSFALNYAFGDLNVWGYHAVNLWLHLVAALLVAGIVGRTLKCPRLVGRYGEAAADWLGAVTALIWMVHPLLTGSVTYISQRTELLGGAFYLLTLYCVIRSKEAARPNDWFILAVCSCALGMGSHEMVITAPVIVFLYDRVFLARSVRQVFHERGRLYAGLAATWVVLARLAVGAARSEAEVQVLALLDALRTQAGVILYYIKLAVWPAPLVLDYGDWPVVRTWADAWPTTTVVAGLVAVSVVWLWRRKSPVAFCGVWFLGMLASVLVTPVAADQVAEPRMYLPLVAVVAVGVVGFWRFMKWHGVRSVLVTAAVAAPLLWLTIRRNDVYGSEVRMGQATVANRPGNARARVNLGAALVKENRLDEALAQFDEALRLRPKLADAHYNRGLVLAMQNQPAEAQRELEVALHLEPDNSRTRRTLGLLLGRQGKLTDAVEQLQIAVRLAGDDAEARNALGTVLAKLGLTQTAVKHFEEAVRLRPDYADARFNLGVALAQEGRKDAAIEQLETVLRLEPGRLKAQEILKFLQEAKPPGR
jgi:protein O-mannosyl-transferase